jgi:hypothetical protein
MEILSPAAFDASSYVVKVDFKDETGAAVQPTSAAWTLTDGSGAVVNGRTSVAVAAPASTIYIALSGDDLDVATTGLLARTRILVVSGQYNSSLVGGQLPVTAGVRFLIQDLPI